MKTYKVKSSANRAAKILMIKYPEIISFEIEEIDGLWSINIITNTKDYNENLLEIVNGVEVVEIKSKKETPKKKKVSRKNEDQIKEEKKEQIGIDEEMALQYGTTFCPGCGVHLENGVTTNEYQLDSKLPGLDKYEYMCLACNHEFGPKIETPKKKKVYPNVSTVQSPCRLVWTIAEAMGTKAKRKEVLIECEKQGVAFYTARTQYQKYKEALRGDIK